MVQKSGPKPDPARRRGRPRAYDPEIALARATDAFWHNGYAATSLDDLGAAMGMNRPSLYGAFGGKRDLYLKALLRYRDLGRVGMRAVRQADLPLPEALRQIYATALELYLSGGGAARGCFSIGTAITEAVSDPEIRAFLLAGMREADEGFTRLVRHAQERGEITANADAAVLGKLVYATLQSLALRARAGASRAELDAMAEAAVTVICGLPAEAAAAET